MKKSVLLLAAALLSAGGIANAQRPGGRPAARPANERVIDAPAPSADMWLYQEELRRREDPYYAIREKAELRARQRQQRIASRKWFGLSNSRPIVNPTPVHGPYGPTWIAHPLRPYQWSGQTSSVHIYTTQRPLSGAMYGLW